MLIVLMGDKPGLISGVRVFNLYACFVRLFAIIHCTVCILMGFIAYWNLQINLLLLLSGHRALVRNFQNHDF